MNDADLKNKVASLGTIMGVWAHPDDETFNSGGIMATAAKNGQTVICITATKGEKGIQDETRWPAASLGDIRSAELQKALDLLGCEVHYWLDYQDGACAADSAERAVARISELIEEHRPDTILTFGPDGLTGHPDHQTVSAWADAASDGRQVIYHVVEEKVVYEKYLAKAAQTANWYFNIQKPPLKPAAECEIALYLTPEIRRTKLAALQAMPSQYEKFFKTTPPELMEHLFTVECFVKA